MSGARRRPPSDELRVKFGSNIRRCRGRLGISQEEAALRADANPAGLSALELGKCLPRIPTFIRIAGALEVDPSELTAGIIWTPAEAIVLPGGFEVSRSPALAAEADALRKADT